MRIVKCLEFLNVFPETYLSLIYGEMYSHGKMVNQIHKRYVYFSKLFNLRHRQYSKSEFSFTVLMMAWAEKLFQINISLWIWFIRYPTNTPRVFHVETTWKQQFLHRFNVENTWCVCIVILEAYWESSQIFIIAIF